MTRARSGVVATPTAGLTTAADALRDEEVERTRRFIRIGWLVAAFAIAAVILMPGDPDLARLLIGAIGVTAAASVGVERILARATSVKGALMTGLALCCVACGALAILYSGYCAGAPLMVVLGIYFFCRTERRSAAILVYVVAAGAHAVVAALVMTGTIDDPGFAPLKPTVTLQAQLAGHLCAQFGYAMAYWLARSTRAASLQSLEELQRATRLAAARAAQLDELRDDLDRALKVGGRGRFTGTVVGSWELGIVLGRGGMGEVYEATHVDDQRLAAVKLLRRELMLDRAHVERFLREVRAASALDSPHVVQVYEASDPEDLVSFLAMERLRGETLGAILRGGGTLDRIGVVELIDQLAGVLELARLAGMVHRDLKPHNVFRTEDRTWKLLDFGVAVLADSSGTLTQGGVIGTPGYMAPEQAKGEAVDHRADLYALGAIAYRCLTGRVPFAGNDMASVLYAMVHDAPVRPSALAALPQDVDRVLAIALAKRKGDRFGRAAELADALRQALANRLSPSLRAAADALIRHHPWRELEVDPQTRELPAGAARIPGT
ncbi:MAG: serine/threonine protein kinase [Myxococcales bacterium]|nr:serine/threonine protein kinase [Myxococcales bacterium]